MIASAELVCVLRMCVVCKGGVFSGGSCIGSERRM